MSNNTISVDNWCNFGLKRVDRRDPVRQLSLYLSLPSFLVLISNVD